MTDLFTDFVAFFLAMGAAWLSMQGDLERATFFVLLAIFIKLPYRSQKS